MSTVLMPYPWQMQAAERVTTLLRQQRLPHAMLLQGPAGIGKQRFAEQLAAVMLCQTRQLCGHCHACHLWKAGYHPDFVCLQPEPPSRVIRIDAVRELHLFLSGTAQQGGFKVIMLTPAESLNTAAANALLKMLEEPAANTLFLLVAHQPSFLPATIRSRCQSIRFSIPPFSESAAWLTQQGFASEEVHHYLSYAGGAPLAALTQLKAGAESTTTVCSLQALEQGVLALAVRTEHPLKLAAAWKAHSLAVCEFLYKKVHDLLQLFFISPATSYTRIEGEIWMNLLKTTKINKLIDFHKPLSEVYRALTLGVPLVPELLLEDLLLRWQGVFAGQGGRE